MATPAVQVERPNYLNSTHGIRSWLLTTDHKRIALLYLMSVTFFFFIGGLFAAAHSPGIVHPRGRPGDRRTPTTSSSPCTGMIMVFFFLIPSIPAILGNFLVPMMVGAKDLAFPKINLLSWYIYIIGGGFR